MDKLLYILNSNTFCNSDSGLRIFALIGITLEIIRIVVPIILIVIGTIELVKAMMLNSDKIKSTQKKLFKKILIGVCIFFIYPLVIFVLSLVSNDFKNNGCFSCLKNPLECQEKSEAIKEEKRKEREEKQAEKRLKLEKEQEEKIEKYDSILKELEEIKAQASLEQNPQSNENNINNGRTLIVQNGTFYLPNQRATSDADTPKGTGEYGLNIDFWNMLSKLINDAKSNGYNVTVSDGWRPYSRQSQTWLTAAHKCDVNWVACPGGSRHGFGIAADLKYDGSSCQGNWNCNSAAAWVHNNASKYGLTFRLSNEPWHIEPSNTVGGNFGACTAPCN